MANTIQFPVRCVGHTSHRMTPKIPNRYTAHPVVQIPMVREVIRLLRGSGINLHRALSEPTPSTALRNHSIIYRGKRQALQPHFLQAKIHSLQSLNLKRKSFPASHEVRQRQIVMVNPKSQSSTSNGSPDSSSLSPDRGFTLIAALIVAFVLAMFTLEKVEASQNLTYDDLKKIAARLGIKLKTKVKVEGNKYYMVVYAAGKKIGKIRISGSDYRNSGEVRIKNEKSNQEMLKKLEEICFNAALKTCKEGKWESIVGMTELLVRLRNRSGQTLFLAAVSSGELPLVKQFLKHDLGVFILDSKGNNGLHLAAGSSNSVLVELLTHHFPLNNKNSDGYAPLHIAILKGDATTVDKLLQIGADSHLTIQDRGINLSPLAWSVSRGQKECFEAILHRLNNSDVQAIISAPIEKVGNILHLALLTDQIEMLKYLLDTHFDITRPMINSGDSEGQTPLHVASMRGDISAIRLLVSKKVPLMVRDSNGRTPMHLAALNEQPDVIQLLFSLGAELNLEDRNGLRPLDLLQNKTSNSAIRCQALLQNLIARNYQDLLAPPDFLKRPPENLVIKGGGPKGLAFIGALLGLQEMNCLGEIKRVAGTSAGGITAALFAFGYTPQELELTMKSMNLTDFLDFSDRAMEQIATETYNNGWGAGLSKAISNFWEGFTWSDPIGTKRRADAFLNTIKNFKGACEGEKIRNWIEDKICAKTGISHCTFGELHELVQKDPDKYKDLHVFTTRLSPDGQSELFRLSSEDPRWKDLVISDAIRCTMSIPGVFKPHTLHFKDLDGIRFNRQDLGSFVDGGILKNFPLDAFDEKKYQPQAGWGAQSNRRTLGLNLHTPDEKVNIQAINTPADLIAGLISTYLEAQEILERADSYNRHRQIDISNQGVGLLDFSLSDATKAQLIRGGRQAAFQAFHKEA